MLRYLVCLVAAVLWAVPVLAQSNSLLIENVTLIDGTGAPPMANASVLDRFDAAIASNPGIEADKVDEVGAVQQ